MRIKRIIVSSFLTAVVLSVPIAASRITVPEQLPVQSASGKPASVWFPLPTQTPSPTAIPEITTDEELIHVQTGLQADGSFDSGTLFIGDSLTRGLVNDYLIKQDLIGDAMYAAIGGHAMQQFFQGTIHLSEETKAERGCVYSKRFQNLTLREAVAEAGEDVTTIYFMMGTNASSKATSEVYTQMMDYLTACCPNATIFMQTVPYSNSGKSDYAFVNANLRQAVESYSGSATQRIYLIDTFTAIGDESNTSDGLHLLERGLAAWYKALVENDALLNPS